MTWAAPRFPDREFAANSRGFLPVQVFIQDFLRRPVPERGVKTSPIITELDPPRNIIRSRLTAHVGGPVDELVLQHAVKGFRHGIIIAYSSPPDGLPDAEFPKFLRERGRGVVAAAVGVGYCAFRA